MVENILKRQITLLSNKLIKLKKLKSELGDRDERILYHSGKNPYFLISTVKDDNRQHRYLSKKNKEEIRLLANLKYLNKLIPLYERIMRNMIQINSDYEEIKAKEKEYYTIYPIKHEDLITPNDVRAKNWESSDFKKNTYPFDPEKQITTIKGEPVRSRAELIIADWLKSHNIPYHYEAALYLKSAGTTVYPDFTVLNPESLSITYIEYFGMMTDPIYASSANRKISEYALNGITVGKNFVPFFEFDNQIDSRVIDETLTALFK